MDHNEIDRVFFGDGYGIAREHLEMEITASGLAAAIVQLYRSMDELLDSFTARCSTEGRPAECRKGCHWCCHQAVFAVTHEWLFLREYILREFPGETADLFRERARSKSEQTLAVSPDKLLKIKAPCPFLDNGACAFYEARPMACRIYLSSSARSCREEFLDPHNEEHIPRLFEFPLRAGRMLNEGFVAFLREKGLHVTELPLEQGYSTMIDTGLTMKGWIDRASPNDRGSVNG